MKSNVPTSPSTLVLPEQRVLAVDDLTIRFANSERTVDAVRNLSFHVDRGETLAIVGESGSGKSVTSLALMRLVEHGGGRIIGGSVALRRRNGQVLDVARASNAVMRDVLTLRDQMTMHRAKRSRRVTYTWPGRTSYSASRRSSTTSHSTTSTMRGKARPNC